FFFQAEDGIRDGHVTGVQTCALPISGECRFLYHFFLARNTGGFSVFWSDTRKRVAMASLVGCACWRYASRMRSSPGARSATYSRSEERRVGKEGSVVWRAGSEE